MGVKSMLSSMKELSLKLIRHKVTFPEKLKGGRIEKIGNYFHNIYSDYKVVAIETAESMREKPLKASAYITFLSAIGFLIKSNPNENSFTYSLMESANRLALVGQAIRSPKTEKHLRELVSNMRDSKLVHINLGVCSFMYEDNYTQGLGLYVAQCGKLKTPWLEIYKNIVDVGINGYWIYLEDAMKDYDVNENEWDETGNMTASSR
ncbi:mitochondrial import inner membrane translocase subunit Tim29 [Octopus sinensis]|uniref:Mitochondrial import inner membrane translocase subunit Tim29 n=1 Tax=Octopus sinensis TaxID=2607531 RepID=A0A6P7SRE1_9MOLL|nr:mitochondrial import inner membrane translocase subunit Tim29 [Octopus sinensis]